MNKKKKMVYDMIDLKTPDGKTVRTRVKKTNAPCVQCGVIQPELSWRGLCKDCAEKNLKNNIKGLEAKQGPEYERWKNGLEQQVRRGKL